MKNLTIFKIFSGLLLVVFSALGFKTISEPSNYKCMIQMNDYKGENAYVIISLLNPEGGYEKTLYVQGEDEDWYSDITAWWAYYGRVRNDIDAITGATISGGARAISMIQLDADKLDKGYKIRFETAVEDRYYYKDDVEFELTSEALNTKVEGHGIIRYVRVMPL